MLTFFNNRMSYITRFQEKAHTEGLEYFNETTLHTIKKQPWVNLTPWLF